MRRGRVLVAAAVLVSGAVGIVPIGEGPAFAEQASTITLAGNPDQQFGLYGYAMGGDGSTVAVTQRQPGQIYVYSTASGSPVLTQTIVPSGRQSGDRTGESVTITGDTMAVAAIYRPSATSGTCINGAVDIFKRNSAGVWVEYGTVFPIGALYSCEGYAGNLHIGGGRLIVSNSIYGLTTYDLTGSAPVAVHQFGYLTFPIAPGGHYTMSSDGTVLVALNGDRSILLYDWNGSGWTRRAGSIVMPAGALTPNEADFGRELVLDGSDLYVIANTQGVVYQYAVTGSGATLVRTFERAGDRFFRGTSGTLDVTANSVFVGSGPTVVQFARATGVLVETYPMPANTDISDVYAADGILLAAAPTAASFNAGRVFGWPTAAVVSPDSTPPTVTGSVAPAPNPAGWSNSAVTVTWSATDPAPSSGLGDVPPPTVVSSEGQGQTVTSPPVCDLAGNCATGSVTVNLDMMAPTLTVTAPTSVAPKGTVTITCSAADALSGIASASCANDSFAATELEAGENTFSFSATDVAGNSTSRTVTITLVVTPSTIGDLIASYLGTTPGANGIVNSLTAKLAAGDLQGFINQVNAQCCKPTKNKRFTAAQAATLIALAQELLS